MVIGTKKLEGPRDYEISLFELLKEADPAISAPYAGRVPEILSVQLVPSPMNSLEEVIDLSAQIPTGSVKCLVAKGNYTLYALVKISGFMEVINGAPGASGPVLNHYNEVAVKKYLHRMSDTIQAQAGSLSGKIRSLFTDSLELEGANWSHDMLDEFQRRDRSRRPRADPGCHTAPYSRTTKSLAWFRPLTFETVAPVSRLGGNFVARTTPS